MRRASPPATPVRLRPSGRESPRRCCSRAANSSTETAAISIPPCSSWRRSTSPARPRTGTARSRAGSSRAVDGMMGRKAWLKGALLAGWLGASCLPSLAADGPPRFHVAAPGGKVTFVVYGDTRFTQRESMADAPARRALVAGIAGENPAAIFIGGDLVNEGDDPADYTTYATETAEWSRRRIPVFPALGNHEFVDCRPAREDSPCLENWWGTFRALRAWRWYSVTIGDSLL